MLYSKTKVGEEIEIGRLIKVKVMSHNGKGQVLLAIEAPDKLPVVKRKLMASAAEQPHNVVPLGPR